MPDDSIAHRQFVCIMAMSHGDTPWQYRDNPGHIEGPFTGESPEAALREAGIDPDGHDWWDRDLDGGRELWIVPMSEGDE
ncbi:MAG: hypothetical protein KC501_41205 [Myxococcales bacterium]|nr:hypothetical protein [Myxococcales bacterium]